MDSSILPSTDTGLFVVVLARNDDDLLIGDLIQGERQRSSLKLLLVWDDDVPILLDIGDSLEQPRTVRGRPQQVSGFVSFINHYFNLLVL
jgi:hypothetical protein